MFHFSLISRSRLFTNVPKTTCFILGSVTEINSFRKLNCSFTESFLVKGGSRGHDRRSWG